MSVLFLILNRGQYTTPAIDISRQETPLNIVYDIAWSPDGSKIAVGIGGDKCSPSIINLLDAESEEEITHLSGSSCPARFLDWSPDGTKIAGTTFEELGVRVWDIATEQVVMTGEPIAYGYLDVKWNPNGETLATTDIGGGVYLVDATTGEITVLILSGSQLDWSPDGTKLVTGSGSQYENKVSVFDILRNQSVFESQGGRLTVDWSPDGTKIVSSSLDSTVRIWDATSGAALFTLSGHSDLVTHVAWNSDNQQVASASNDGTVRIWDALTGEALEVIKVGSRVFAVAWSPDGSQLYGGIEGKVTIVELSDSTITSATPFPTITPTLTPQP